MDVKPPWPVQFREIAVDTLAGMAVFALLWLLVSVRARRLRLPTILIALAVLMIAIDDASFLGGVRPFDSGDDGLFYDSVGREILQHALSGNWYEALRGGENVFYYGGPGLRYFRALEHVLFGETYFGYLSLVLLLPFRDAGVVPPISRRAVGACARFIVCRGADRRFVRHDLHPIRQMGGEGLCRSGGVHLFLLPALPSRRT